MDCGLWNWENVNTLFDMSSCVRFFFLLSYISCVFLLLCLKHARLDVYKSHDTCSKSAINKSFSSSFWMWSGNITLCCYSAHLSLSRFVCCFQQFFLPCVCVCVCSHCTMRARGRERTTQTERAEKKCNKTQQMKQKGNTQWTNWNIKTQRQCNGSNREKTTATPFSCT